MEARNRLADEYTTKYNRQFVVPILPEGYICSWAQYTVRSKRRDESVQDFEDQEIPTMIYYRTCMHQQTAFIHLGYKVGDFPVAEVISKQVFSLPMDGYR